MKRRILVLPTLVLAACNAKASADPVGGGASIGSASGSSSGSVAALGTANSSASARPSSSSSSPPPPSPALADASSEIRLGLSASATPSNSSASAAAPNDTADGGPSDHPLAHYKMVVHVGDSMVGYHMGLQLELGKMWKTIGVRYEALTVTAAGLHSFATDKHVEKMVKAKDPDLVIVQVGTNNLTVPHPEAYLADVKNIVAQTQTGGVRRCVWIGPIPLEQPEHGMRRLLRENVGPCTFYDSWDLDLKRQSDNIHPTQLASKKWANAFWEFASTKLASPTSPTSPASPTGPTSQPMAGQADSGTN